MIATCVLLIVGSILCTAAYGGDASATLWFLVVARVVLGIGIGGEYPLAASSSAEDSTSSAERNTRVATTFSLQGVGQVVAAILGNLLVEALADGKPGENSDSRLETVWRLLFAIGCVPALVICYYASPLRKPKHTRPCRSAPTLSLVWVQRRRPVFRSLSATTGLVFSVRPAHGSSSTSSTTRRTCSQPVSCR
ncbi:unnamed protein product [Phytophthora fragariaefolia]|uniref:Unnamed protein product n=1 Tax=Phytophthora fragariaefolia TaxID=1490495 RepID=A0A9W6YKI5_9STRA|nr:unnamed protein product [Phytophthora fragariaefolia]